MAHGRNRIPDANVASMARPFARAQQSKRIISMGLRLSRAARPIRGLIAGACHEIGVQLVRLIVLLLGLIAAAWAAQGGFGVAGIWS